MYDLPPVPPEEDDWFSRHKGLAFLLAVALTFVIPLVFMMAAGAFVLIAREVLTHALAALGGGLIVWFVMRSRR